MHIHDNPTDTLRHSARSYESKPRQRCTTDDPVRYCAEYVGNQAESHPSTATADFIHFLDANWAARFHLVPLARAPFHDMFQNLRCGTGAATSSYSARVRRHFDPRLHLNRSLNSCGHSRILDVSVATCRISLRLLAIVFELLVGHARDWNFRCTCHPRHFRSRRTATVTCVETRPTARTHCGCAEVRHSVCPCHFFVQYFALLAWLHCSTQLAFPGLQRRKVRCSSIK